MTRLGSQISIEGPVSAGLVPWRLGARLRATVVVKTCLEFSTSGGVELVRPLPIFIKDRVSSGGEVAAASDLAPFVPSPEIMVIGRALHRQGVARVGFRLERGTDTVMQKHIDVEAGALLGALGPQRSAWPVAPEAFDAGVVELPSADGACFQRAAADQRATEIRGHEELVLIGLHPSAPLLRVPVHAPVVTANVLTGTFSDAVPLRIDALIVTLADRKITLLYRGSVPLRFTADRPGWEAGLAHVRVQVKAQPDPRVRAAAAAPAAGAKGANEDAAMGTIALDDGSNGMQTVTLSDIPMGAGKRSTLPFQGDRARSPSSSSTAATPWGQQGPTPSVRAAEGVMATLDLADDESPLGDAESAASAAPVAPVAAPAPGQTGEVPTPSKAVWRDDPSADVKPEAPAPAPPTVKKDLNAALYKRPKLKR